MLRLPAIEDDARLEEVSEPALENSSLNSLSERLRPGRCSAINSIESSHPESLSELSTSAAMCLGFHIGRNCMFTGSGGAGGTAGGSGIAENTGSTSAAIII